MNTCSFATIRTTSRDAPRPQRGHTRRYQVEGLGNRRKRPSPKACRAATRGTALRQAMGRGFGGCRLSVGRAGAGGTPVPSPDSCSLSPRQLLPANPPGGTRGESSLGSTRDSRTSPPFSYLTLSGLRQGAQKLCCTLRQRGGRAARRLSRPLREEALHLLAELRLDGPS